MRWRGVGDGLCALWGVHKSSAGGGGRRRTTAGLPGSVVNEVVLPPPAALASPWAPEEAPLCALASRPSRPRRPPPAARPSPRSSVSPGPRHGVGRRPRPAGWAAPPLSATPAPATPLPTAPLPTAPPPPPPPPPATPLPTVPSSPLPNGPAAGPAPPGPAPAGPGGPGHQEPPDHPQLAERLRPGDGHGDGEHILGPVVHGISGDPVGVELGVELATATRSAGNPPAGGAADAGCRWPTPRRLPRRAPLATWRS